MSELCPSYQTQNLPKLDFILADQSVMLSNWWDNHSSAQKVPTCGVCCCYFCWLDGRYSNGSSNCVVGCWPIVAGCNCISYWRTFCWYTYSYFYLKLDEKEQSDKPPQQSSTKKTGKQKCFINNWNHKKV